MILTSMSSFHRSSFLFLTMLLSLFHCRSCKAFILHSIDHISPLTCHGKIQVKGSTAMPDKVILLPNPRNEIKVETSWYTRLEKYISETQRHPFDISIGSLPDIYAFNNKRFERFWLGLMGTDDLCIDENVYIIAEGQAADATLRFAERNRIFGALLIDSGDFYHAAERHGRPYLWSQIKQNSNQNLSLLFREENNLEGRSVQSFLGVSEKRYDIIHTEPDFYPAILGMLEDVGLLCVHNLV